MKWTGIISIIEARSQPKFPTLPCYQQFSDGFNQTPQPITYDKLMKENFENTFSRTRFPLFEDAGQCGIDLLAYYRSFHRSQHGWGIYIIDAGVDLSQKKSWNWTARIIMCQRQTRSAH